MTLRQYLVIMLLGSVLCAVAWGMVIINIDPYHADGTGFFFFYLTLFFSLIGLISVIVFFGYYWFSRSELPLYRYVQKSFRDGVILSAVIIGLLLLQQRQMLSWWNGVVLGFFLLFLLLFHLSTRMRRHA